MKKLQLLTAIAGLATTGTALAFSYGSPTEAPVGTAAFERHAFAFTTNAVDCNDTIDVNGDTVGDNLCLVGGSDTSEFSVALEVTNATSCDPAAPFPAVCSPVNVADSYDGSALAQVGDARLHAPLNTTDGRDQNLVTSFAVADTAIDTDATGRFTSGVIVADSTFTGTGTIGVFFFPELRARTFRGETASPLWTATALGAPVPTNVCATTLSIPYQACISSDGPAGEIDILPAAEQDFDYIIAPEGTGGGKAVPVPAFAAAALGLGLVAITILSSRRRALK